MQKECENIIFKTEIEKTIHLTQKKALTLPIQTA